jgi:probable F420-dependent oxidoreductase
MKFGLFAINMGVCADPAIGSAVAGSAEQAGFESIWAGEHVVLPDPQAPPSPLPPETPMLDPTVALTFVAAHTKRVRLGTGIIILPQRNPLVLAKELASLDVLSNGRLTFGIGIGYLKAEFDALGAPFEKKGRRTEDYLKAILAIWSMPTPEYRGEFFSFAGVDAMPRPVQKPHPEIVFGGHTKQAYARAARLANGWYGFALDVAAAGKCLEGLRRACDEFGRRFDELEISVTPLVDGKAFGAPLPPPADQVKRYADLGVNRLILCPPVTAHDATQRYIDAAAQSLIGKVG